jgi:hypothetical protein
VAVGVSVRWRNVTVKLIQAKRSNKIEAKA